MKLYNLWTFVTLFLFISSAISQSSEDSSGFINGADLSFLPEMEDLGGIYYNDDGVPQDAIQIFKDHGFDYVRLKLWHTPDEDYNNLEKILFMSTRIKNDSMKILLNFHYSDTWADPGKQYKPAAWEGLTFEILKDSVYQYTKKVLQALNNQGTLPDMVQIGNEINPGMLWNDGRVGGQYDTPAQWANLGALINEGIRGIRDSGEGADSVKIMIHIANAANNSGCRWFFDNLTAHVSDFDYIGLSFYPWWHGTLDAVRTNLNDLALRYNKNIIIVEMAYPWTLDWNDDNGNIVGSTDQLHDGYHATVSGQTNYLRELIKIVHNVRDQRGKGVFYWAPDWISVEPVGSSWENVTLFDFNEQVLSSMDVFLEKPIDLTPVNVTIRANTASHWDTLQPYHFAQIRGEVSGNSYGTLPDGKEVTWEADCDLIMNNIGGDYWEAKFQMYPEDMLTYKFWTGYTIDQSTYLRLGWEGPIIPPNGLGGDKRIIIAGERDTVISLQFYNSLGVAADQYWYPYEQKQDSLAVYFRLNMSGVTSSGRFDPAINGPVAVRGDALNSGGSLDWDTSKVILQQEEYSINNGSFWSGVCFIPLNAIDPGDTLRYNFFIENDSQNGWENNISYRELKFTDSLVQGNRDTTLHWVYFDETAVSGIVNPQIRFSPQHYQLYQNFPNPFNNQTRIRYRVDKSGFVSLKVYDVRGRLISTLVHHKQMPGIYSIYWSASNDNGSVLPSGIYYIRLETAYGRQSRKMLLLK